MAFRALAEAPQQGEPCHRQVEAGLHAGPKERHSEGLKEPGLLEADPDRPGNQENWQEWAQVPMHAEEAQPASSPHANPALALQHL